MNEQTQTQLKKLRKILRHIRNVQEAAFLLGERLMERGDIDLGKQLIANSLKHDQSKFFGIEWDHMADDTDPLLEEAIKHHQRVNDHHPEFWGNIRDMPKLSVAEMVCDWKSRSQEFGTDLRAWIKEVALSKYDITTQTKVYKQIKYFVDILLDDSFRNVTFKKTPASDGGEKMQKPVDK